MPCNHFNRLIIGCLLLLLATACNPLASNTEAYPLPPATQALATLLARGVATSDVREYPPPIPGPLAAPPTNSTLATAYPYPIPTTTAAPSEVPAAVQAARGFLAGRLSLAVRQVALLSWETATWTTPNLGCQPSAVINLQNPIPGYRITLRAEGQTYELHSDQGGEEICLAEPLQPGDRIPLARDSSQAQVAELAQAHLASRLGLPIDQVVIESSEPAEWEDDSLGCALPPGNQPDRAYARPIPGYRILLSARGQTYEYHSGGFWLVYCGEKR